ncbi:phosphatidylserine/phosphatidylglycerophosphate/cardiolipin synthase family protein [Herbaspirillum sp. YR522]|uniref:phospholipase D-like domain-containing protein n=1 Tax=Herbaspirillum sp. YR522 TaxID=1144342 RepID=UPI00026F9A76|nr:phospholipase D-like domain-containing protein [Herbaspirillum sp. YR522]EJM96091.1 phosphatidylserine/phosphatidylglycerophosphate/cardiolipin synthase [Herbaspirillum sp. YR522]
MRHTNFTDGNEIVLLHSGAAYYPALIAAIEAARVEIYLETYIFAIDDTGVLVRDALQRAVLRGVVVYVITDWTGTGRAHSAQLKQFFAAAGVQHRSFNPWFRRGVARSHRKLCVVDRQVAFVGGLNINDDFISDSGHAIPLPAPRWDFAVRITGNLVHEIYREMEAQWLRVGHMKLKARWENFKRLRHGLTLPVHQGAQAALVVRDNFRNRRTIQRVYLQALGRARESAFLANPYFAPGRKMRRALEQAAQRGVRVTLLLGVGQFAMQDAVAHYFYPKLLGAGVRIIEYTKTQLHAKVAVVDDHWSTVGSSNVDGLSLFVNQEANVVIQDTAFAQYLRQEIEAGAAQGRVVHLSDFAHVPWYRRAGYGAAFLLYRTVIHVITLGRSA